MCKSFVGDFDFLSLLRVIVLDVVFIRFFKKEIGDKNIIVFILKIFYLEIVNLLCLWKKCSVIYIFRYKFISENNVNYSSSEMLFFVY